MSQTAAEASAQNRTLDLYDDVDVVAEPIDLAEQPPGSRISNPTRTRRAEVSSTLEERFGVPRSTVERPKKLRDLVRLVQQTSANKGRLRAIGAARGLSVASRPTGVTVVSLEKLNAVYLRNNLDLSNLKRRADVPVDTVVRTQGGTPFRKVLRKLRRKQRAVASHGSGDFQSVAGALSTATHGTGAPWPSLSGQVRALVVVRTHGTVARVELIQRAETTDRSEPTSPCYRAPTGGRWSAKDGTVVHAVFDDDTFFAHTVGLGCLGLIYSVTLATVPAMLLEEFRTPMWLPDALAKVKQLQGGSNRLEIVLDPYPREIDPRGLIASEVVHTAAWKLGNVRCQLVTKQPTATDPANGRPRPLPMNAGSMRAARGMLGRMVRGFLKKPHKRCPNAAQTLLSCSSMPDDGRPGHIDTTPDILLLNLKYWGFGAEWAVPLAHLDDAIEIVLNACVDGFRKLPAGTDTDELVRAYSANTPFYQGPTVRFVKGEPGLMAATHDTDNADQPVAIWACIEVGFLLAPRLMKTWGKRKRYTPTRPEDAQTTTQVDDLLGTVLKPKDAPPADASWMPPRRDDKPDKGEDRMLRLHAAYLRGARGTLDRIRLGLAPLGGRPHQGLYHGLTWSEVEASWGAAATRWKTVFLEANNGVFDGPLTDQWQIRAAGPNT